MKNLKDLKIKIYKDKEYIIYVNYNRKIILRKKENIVENIEDLNFIDYFKNKENIENNDCNNLWVYEFMGFDNDILKAECMFWDGWSDKIYKTKGLNIDKSNENRIIISYEKNLFKEVFWFIKKGIAMCYHWDDKSEIYINNSDIEDLVDLINLIKNNNKIEIILNSIAYEQIKDVKITIGFELFL